VIISQLTFCLLLYYFDQPSPSVECDTEHTFLLIILNAVWLFLISVFLTYLLWDVRDAFLFKFEMVCLITLTPPFFIIWAIAFAIGWTGIIAAHLWVSIAEIIFLFVSLGIPSFGSFIYSLRIREGKLMYKNDGSMEMSERSNLEEKEIGENDQKDPEKGKEKTNEKKKQRKNKLEISSL